MSAISCTGAKTKCVYYRKYGPNLKLLNTGQLRGDLFMNEDLHHLQKKTIFRNKRNHLHKHNHI